VVNGPHGLKSCVFGRSPRFLEVCEAATQRKWQDAYLHGPLPS